jgi:glutamine amidotransferase
MDGNSVAIIDSGGANIASVAFALDRLGASYEVTTDPGKIGSAGHVILPGVGAAADAMERIRAGNLAEFIPTLTQPVLGICLGMQLLADASEEDDADCLGIVSGRARKLESGSGSPVPNIGWSRVYHGANHPLLDGIEDGSYFYFLHSYALDVSDYSLGTARHRDEFTAVLGHNNFVATQFHPEKSSSAGTQLLTNFLRM